MNTPQFVTFHDAGHPPLVKIRLPAGIHLAKSEYLQVYEWRKVKGEAGSGGGDVANVLHPRSSKSRPGAPARDDGGQVGLVVSHVPKPGHGAPG
jgi:hypothetical protein